MSKIGEVFGAFAIALAALFGLTSRSGAEPVGPTGHTPVECVDICIDCINDCGDNFGICLSQKDPPIASSYCNDVYNKCGQGCRDEEEACDPPKAGGTPLRLGVIVEGQLRTFEGLAKLSTKLDL